MPAKTALKKTPEITFEVRFIGQGIEPDNVPLRAVHDALTAIQDIASGRDPFESSAALPEKAIGLIDVRRGSAVYCCHAHNPKEAVSNLSRIGKLLATDDEKTEWEELAPAVSSIKAICDVARSIGCRLEVRTPKAKTRSTILALQEDDYERIKKRVFLTGDTMIAGRVERVGGATEMRCALRVPGRHKLLFCTVENEKLARQLGQHLYEDIVATGTAVWIHAIWRVHQFKIREFSQPRLGDPDEAIAALRAAGLDSWDTVKKPEQLIEEMRW